MADSRCSGSSADAWEEEPAAATEAAPRPPRSKADGSKDGGTLLDLLEALVSRSLAERGEGPDGSPRPWMLETIWEFGLERLRGVGEEERARRLHAEYFLHLAEEGAPELTGPAQARWTARLAADHDNLRSALDWAEAQEEAEPGLRLGAALWRFWAIRGHVREGLPPSRLEEWTALLKRGREEAGADSFESARLHGAGLRTPDAVDLARSHLTSS